MNELSFYESTDALSRQLSRKRGSPLNYFLSPFIERYLKRLEAQMGMTQVGASANPLAPDPLARAIRGGMSGGTDMEPPSF